MKKILLAVTGSISAYKSIELLRFLQKENFDIDIVITQEAKKFIGVATFEGLLNKKIYHDMWDNNDVWMPHINLGNVDLIIIAPATANTIAKAANGIADNLLTNIILSSKAKKLLVPAMNGNMYENSITQDNLSKLKRFGYKIIEPEWGQMACNTVGRGRYAQISKIVLEVHRQLNSEQKLKKRKILITAGGTRESIDPVRYIGNWATGTIGYHLARYAYIAGADVEFIGVNYNYEVLPEQIIQSYVKSNDELYEKIMNRINNIDTLIMAAAVGDYKPVDPSKKKIKKSENLMLELNTTRDILYEVKQWKKNNKSNLKVVAFSAETENLVENTKKKMGLKDTDLIVANKVPDSFGSGVMSGVIMSDKNEEIFNNVQKAELARQIIDFLE